RQVALLKQGVSSEVPEVAAWAVRTLARADPQAVLALADGLASNGKIPVAAQVALDDVLSDLKEGWRISEERIKLLEGWVSGKKDSYHSHILINRLDNAVARPEFDDRVALRLLKTAVEN